MKKIIAISVMLALVAGAVFADTAIGGYVETRFQPAKQMGADGDDPKIGGSIGTAYINLSGSNGDGTLGGTTRFRFQDARRTGNGGVWIHKAFVWWKPVEQVKIFLGIENDGLFDTADFVGWGYHSGDNDYIFNHHWDFWRQIFPGNWDGFGLALSFYPIPGLDINLALPTGGVNWPQATAANTDRDVPLTNPDSSNKTGMLPGRLRLVVNYSLDFGKISFIYLGGAIVAEKGLATKIENGFGVAADNNGQVGASVLVTAIDGILIKVGGSAILTDPDVLINGGFGVAYSGDGFGVKARAGVMLQGDAKPFIHGSVMPTVNVGEKGTVLFDIGVTKQDDQLGWFLTPAYRLKIDGGQFAIGFQVLSNITGGGNIVWGEGVPWTAGTPNNTREYDHIKWNIPMSLGFQF